MRRFFTRRLECTCEVGGRKASTIKLVGQLIPNVKTRRAAIDLNSGNKVNPLLLVV
jgi:hypothetical protein